MASRVNACDRDNLIIANSHNYSYSNMIVLSIIHSLIIMPILYIQFVEVVNFTVANFQVVNTSL